MNEADRCFMKTIFRSVILFFCIVCFNYHLAAQVIQKGDIICSLSFGIPHLEKLKIKTSTQSHSFKSSFKGTVKVNYIRGTNPLTFKYEYCLGKYFGLGASLSFWSVRVNFQDDYAGGKYTDSYYYKFSCIALGIRPNFHIPIEDKKADLYIGCAIGLSKRSVSADFHSSTVNLNPYNYSYLEHDYKATLFVAPTLGYRKYISKNFGLNVELGYENRALFQVGLVFRFRPIKFEPYK